MSLVLTKLTVPGVFPAVSTFMISQKASDDMIAELKAGKAVEVCSAKAA